LKNLKTPPKRLLALINKFNKVAECNMQKSVAFLYTSSDFSDKEIMKAIPFTIATKILKYPGINLT
jgi:hypothetical protein